MTKEFPREQWKEIKFDFEYTNSGTIEISNYGRIRTFNKISKGNIINGSMINGYKIIRLKFYKPRDEKAEKKFKQLQNKAIKMARAVKDLQESGAKKEAKEAAKELAAFKKDLSAKFNQDLKERTIHYHSLIHRLVATYFCKQPSPKHTIVSHIDHDKLNNKSSNIKWMLPEQNYAHQQKSPIVIAEKKERRKEDSKAAKLTIPKVMQLKKLLNDGKPIKTLVKQFKVTDTQILRIKRGENWGDIQPAT
ncbi:NUMOD4 domain-containing protein [Limnovirga soli]|uniref:NUMOD4 domain-containing protein n=1 Tax=Limnovirga soli TaxID=2656915 RepID=A0A8J8JTQ4_9BACT|nr:NUMOD4 domain-containing protein [Limnovirga soli]NNV55445.1 hypothetical protein [Limnovirga soli]